MGPECLTLLGAPAWREVSHLLEAFLKMVAGNCSWSKEGTVPQLPEELPSGEAGAGSYEAHSPSLCVVLHLSLNWSCRGPCPELHSERDYSGSYSPPHSPFFYFAVSLLDSIQQQHTPSLYILRNTNPRLLLVEIFLFGIALLLGQKTGQGRVTGR